MLFSPIAHEDLHSPDLPDGKENNQRLAVYTRAMEQVAKAQNITFVDLFTPSTQLYAAARTPLTMHGVHLTAEGDRQIAQVIDRALFGDPAKLATETYLSTLRAAVMDKNFHWFNRYRVTDGFSTYGDRAFLSFIRGNPRNVNANQMAGVAKEDVLPTNYEVLQREVSVLDVMTAQSRQAHLGDRARAGSEGDDAQGRRLRTRRRSIDAMTNEPGKGPNGAHIFIDGESAIGQMTVGHGSEGASSSHRSGSSPSSSIRCRWPSTRKGRLWVACWKSYPHWQPKTPMDDKLLILEDTNGDGNADKRTVFAGDLNNPTGFEF